MQVKSIPGLTWTYKYKNTSYQSYRYCKKSLNILLLKIFPRKIRSQSFTLEKRIIENFSSFEVALAFTATTTHVICNGPSVYFKWRWERFERSNVGWSREGPNNVDPVLSNSAASSLLCPSLVNCIQFSLDSNPIGHVLVPWNSWYLLHFLCSSGTTQTKKVHDFKDHYFVTGKSEKGSNLSLGSRLT